MESEKPVVPTREEVLAAGYKEEVVDSIIDRQVELLAEWEAANTAPAPDPVAPIGLKVIGDNLRFTCPGCQAELNIENHRSLVDSIVACGCGCAVDLKA